MNLNILLTIVLVFAALLLILFCAFFSARLAQLKGRSRAWGILGLFFNVLGFIAVCFLPSKRTDNMNTNPILHFSSRLPSLSKKTIGIVIGVGIAAVLTVLAYDNVPKFIENYKYSKAITEKTLSEYEQPYMITGQVERIFASDESTYLTSTDGDLYCWGKQLTAPIEEGKKGVIYKNAKKAVSTDTLLFVLNNKNELYVIGDNSKGLAPVEKTVLEKFTLVESNVIDFSVSEKTLGFIKNNNKLYMYGNNAYGQLGTYSTAPVDKPVAVLGSVAEIHCEADYTVALQQSGDAVAFGSNAYKQFGKSEEKFTSPVVIKNNVAHIAAGDDFILLTDKNGELFACGNNNYGQLGNLTNEKSETFISILKDVKSVYASKRSAYALSNNNELYSWGQNNVGQLGTGNTHNLNTPTVCAQNVEDVAISGLHTVIITTENDVLSTGYNNFDQLGKGKTRDSFSTQVTVKAK